MANVLKRFWADEKGATSIEYALISAGIGMTVIAGVDAAGKAVNNAFAKIAGDLDGSTPMGDGLTAGAPPGDPASTNEGAAAGASAGKPG